MNGRDIKFRAWDKEEKRMLDWYHHEDLIKDAIPWENGDEWTERCEVMQFIGMYDKNGREIYEGDIIRSNQHNPKTFIVAFVEGGFCATHPDLSSYPPDINHFYPSTGCVIEVVGNVFEGIKE